MRRLRAQIATTAAAFVLAATASQAGVGVDFIPLTPAHRHAADAYARIWEAHGERIVAALERVTCLPFAEPRVAAVVADATSNSGGPEFPMRLRATYPDRVKQATLVHELGHRHLWQLEQRLDDIDGHRTLFLVLDRVWAAVWGEDFAATGIETESAWEMRYDYGAAWAWARALAPDERARLWNELLAMNGFAAGCNTLVAELQ